MNKDRLESLGYVALLLAASLACGKGAPSGTGDAPAAAGPKSPEDIAKAEFKDGERKAEAACRALDKAGVIARDPLLGHADCSAAKTAMGPKDTAFSYSQRFEGFKAAGFVRVDFTPVGLFSVNGIPVKGTVEYVSTSSPFGEPGSDTPADDYPAQDVASSKSRLKIWWSNSLLSGDTPWDKCRAKKTSVKECAKRYPKEYSNARELYVAAKRVVDLDLREEP